MALQTYEDIDLTDFMCIGFNHSWNMRDFPCTNSGVVKRDYLLDLNNKNTFYKKGANGSSMIGFPFVIADSEQDMPGIKPGPLGRHTSALTNELQEVCR